MTLFQIIKSIVGKWFNCSNHDVNFLKTIHYLQKNGATRKAKPRVGTIKN